MKRFLLLMTMLALSFGGVGLVLIAVAGSGHQFSERIKAQWHVGKLSLQHPRMADLATVHFDRMRLRSDRSWKSWLDLRDVQWRRGVLLPHSRDDELSHAELTFHDGVLRLTYRDGQGWVFLDDGMRNSVALSSRLPASVRGGALRVVVERESPAPSRIAHLEFRAVDPALLQLDDGLELRAELEGDSWRHGSLAWRASSQGESLRVRVDDVALGSFPFVALARLFSFPWPPEISAPLAGTGDLDWQVDAGRFQLQHHLSTVPITRAKKPFEKVNGTLVGSPGRLDWTIDSGRFSQSRLHGHIVMDLVRRTVEGELHLAEIINDEGLAFQLPDPWGKFIAYQTLSGTGQLSLQLDGSLQGSLAKLVASAGLHLEGVTLDALRSAGGFTGDMRIASSQANRGWDIEGNTGALVLAGVEIPECTWTGELRSDLVRLRRRESGAPRIRVALTAANDPSMKSLHFEIQVQDSGVGGALRQGLGDARLSVTLQGDWTEEKGAVWEAWLHWETPDVERGVFWPVRAPAGRTLGDVYLRSLGGTVYIPWLRMRDDSGLWLARGEVRGAAYWHLTGIEIDGEKTLPFALDIPGILDFPPQGSRAFELSGPLWRWKPEAALGKG